MKPLKAKCLQDLHREIYKAEGIDRVTATLRQKHEAQRRYSITREGMKYVATKL